MAVISSYRPEYRVEALLLCAPIKKEIDDAYNDWIAGVLTGWERKFITSLDSQLKIESWEISDKQLIALRRISAKFLGED